MIRKILVINPFGIGDVIFSMVLVEELKKSLPGARIGFLGNERTVGLLRMNGSIDVCHVFNRDELRALRNKGLQFYVLRLKEYFNELKKERYDTVFDLSLGREFSFAAFLAGIPRRIGFNYKGRGLFLTHRTPFFGYEGKHVVDWQLSLLRHAGIESGAPFVKPTLSVSPGANQKASGWMSSRGMKPDSKYFIVAPGGGRSWGENAVYKQWSPEKFAEAANRWASHGGAIVLLGDSGEAGLLDEVGKQLKGPFVTASDLALEISAAIIQRAEFLLGNDGGLVHLANALGVKTVSLYGPVDEKVYGPYNGGTKQEVLMEPVPCRPCYQRFHFPACEHQRRCLEELSTEKVLAAIQKIS